MNLESEERLSRPRITSTRAPETSSAVTPQDPCELEIAKSLTWKTVLRRLVTSRHSARTSPCLVEINYARCRLQLAVQKLNSCTEKIRHLYKTVAAHVDNYFADVESQGQLIPKYIRNEFEEFLKCGILAHGIVRIGCTDCKTERLVALSCKKRGFCSSCAARRQAELVDYLSEKVFVEVPVRQYVLSFPFELRYWLSASGRLLGECCRIFAAEVEAQILKKSSAVKARAGTVTVFQRFSSDLSLNPHFHMLAADGVFVSRSTGREKFISVPAITDEEVSVLVERVASRVIKHLVKRNYITEEEVLDDKPTEKLFEESTSSLLHTFQSYIELR